MMSSSGQSKLKKKHFRVKHQKVKLFRANEPFLSVFMWGINHTVSAIDPLALSDLVKYTASHKHLEKLCITQLTVR